MIRFIFLLLISVRLVGQNFPVEGMFRFTPPYYIDFNSYSLTASSNQMGLTITLKDQSYVGDRRVRLVLQVFRDNTKIAESIRGTTIGSEYALASFVPVYINGDELNVFFKRQNLRTFGVDYNTTFNEGFYRFGFIVEDIITGNILSTTISQIAYITYLESPLLDAPIAKAQIEPMDGGVQPMIQFMWQPRGFGGLGETEYELKIIEIIDTTQSDIVNFMLRENFPVYQNIIKGANQIMIFNTDLPLNEGKKYAWRVQARNMINGESVAYYKNQGKSEIRSFTYKKECPKPMGIKIESQHYYDAKVSWRGDPVKHTKFDVWVSDRNDDHYTKYDTTAEEKLVQFEKPNFEYDVRVRAYCGTQATDWVKQAYETPSTTFNATTAPCGVPSPKVKRDWSKGKPVTDLKVGDTVHFAYQKYCVTTQIDEKIGESVYNGKCVGPFVIFGTEILLRQIYVKTDVWWYEGQRRMRHGKIRSEPDPNWKNNMININALLNEATQIETGGGNSSVQSGIEAPLPSFSKKFNIEDVQASTDKNDPSTIKINIKGEAKNISFPIKLPFKAEATNPSNTNPLNQTEPSAAVAIEDKDGGVYEVDDKGKTKKIGNKGSELPPAEYKEAARKMNVRLGRATTPKLMFKALASEPLAFDEWQENFKGKSIIEKEYQKIGENYYVPIKLIPAGMTGKVQVDLNGINKDSVIFKTPNGSVYTLQENNILSIAGAKNGDGIELYAQNKFDSTIIYGKLNIYGYEIKNLKVNIVPVNSTATIEKEKLENELNKIYYPYGVSISLNVINKIEDKSWDLNNDGKLDVGETGILNFRTEEMKAVHRLNENKNADEIYLYLMQTPSKAGVEGDMPLGSQYGFLFGEISARTLSHEIAHGYFQLKHSFDESIALQKSSTNNLMDYANGNALYKYQWDLVHDKGLMIAKLWQSDSAGEFGLKRHYNVTKNILLQYQVDEETADEIAYYASVYADHPEEWVSKLNQKNNNIMESDMKKGSYTPSTSATDIMNNVEPEPQPVFNIGGKYYTSFDGSYEYIPSNMFQNTTRYGSEDRTKNSQRDHLIDSSGGVSLHAMRTWWERDPSDNLKPLPSFKYLTDTLNIPQDTARIILTNGANISREEAVRRALYGGNYIELNGKKTYIEGAINVINRYVALRLTPATLKTLPQEQKKEIGLALHTIQDAIAHQGGRWIELNSDGRKIAKKLNHKDEHNIIKDIFFYGGKLKQETEKWIHALLPLPSK